MKTYYDNLFTKAVSTKSEYIKKIESLIFAEKSVDKNGIVFSFLEQKLAKIKDSGSVKTLRVFENVQAKNFYAVAVVNNQRKVFVNYFKFENGIEMTEQWTSELEHFIPAIKEWCEINNFNLWSY